MKWFEEQVTPPRPLPPPCCRPLAAAPSDRPAQPLTDPLHPLPLLLEQELRDLCAAVGLTDFQRHRSNRFILFSARKPRGAPSTGAPL